jgi:hypothetical protein
MQHPKNLSKLKRQTVFEIYRLTKLVDFYYTRVNEKYQAEYININGLIERATK